ncbi:MAG: flagellar basal-body MS-ring/collar protein FliF [Rhodomicrobiaceae bacterium]
MTGQEQLERLQTSLLNLGARRLAALAFVGVTVFAAVAFGSYHLSRPTYETLYVGITQEDAMRMGSVLRDAGIRFDMAADGTQIMVPYGETAQARMFLAERGLPTSATAGYELFDKLGPVGLTSFMQDITRVRALEGEIARTVQTMRGVKAARVHIVMADEGSFRRNRRPPSASVVIRTDGMRAFPGAPAVRHLVASAVPGLNPDQVTVLNSDGRVLAAGGETIDGAPHKMVELEKAVSDELQENVRTTLAPYLGLKNFEISVTTKLNIDERQTNETTYDPDSRVERSVRNIKETSQSQNADGNANVTVEQNIPGDQTAALPGAGSSSQKERREDLSNFELNTKKVATISKGYQIENVTVAVVLNKRQLVASLGQDPTPEAIQNQLEEVQKVVETAAGIDTARGDRVTVAAVDFVVDTERLEPVASPGIVEHLVRQSSSYLNALAIVVAAFLLVWFGLRPALRAILEEPRQLEAATQSQAALAGGRDDATLLSGPDDELLEGVKKNRAPTPVERLEKLIETDEEAAAALIKQLLKS